MKTISVKRKSCDFGFNTDRPPPPPPPPHPPPPPLLAQNDVLLSCDFIASFLAGVSLVRVHLSQHGSADTSLIIVTNTYPQFDVNIYKM